MEKIALRKSMRRIKCLVGIIVITVAAAIWAQAQDFIWYINNGTVAIKFYTGSGSDVTIPDEIGGVPVARIEQFAFSSATSMTNLTLGKNITSLAVTAFDLCNSLRTITVDALNPVYRSVAGVLFDISQTTLVRYPSGKSGAYTIPDTVTRVGGYAFSGCLGLTSITIPNGVTHFEDFAFYACPNLTSVTITDTISNFGDHTFHSCTGLTNVIFPGSLTRIGAFAFCLSSAGNGGLGFDFCRSSHSVMDASAAADSIRRPQFWRANQRVRFRDLLGS